jgi:hypothetical protein
MKIRSLLSLAALALALPASNGFAAEPAAAAVPEHNDEQKALVKALDSELGRFEALIKKVDDPKYAEFLTGQLKGLRERRDAFLKVAFDGGKYDELRYDLNVEYQRAAQWLLPPLAPTSRK